MELSLAKPALPRKPLLLKDFLLDDLSSCSSSGFRSYPRRQCCATIRFLLEIDLKNKPPKYIQKPPHRSPSKPPSPSSPPSALRRASTAFINAVKSSSSLSNKLKLTLLPRTLSRKLLKRGFWKRPDRKGIRSGQPSSQLNLKNSSPPSDFTGSPTSGYPRSSTSDSNLKSNSWSDTEFTASDVSTNGNSADKILNEARHDVVSGETKRFPKDKAVRRSKRVGVLVGEDYSATEATSTSSNGCATSSNNFKCASHEEEKEQFSPVSVLDCPFDDDDEVSSPFQHKLAHMEGTKNRLLRKIKKFERLTQLEPVNLEKRIVLSESDRDSDRSPHCHSSESAPEDFIVDSEDEEIQASKDKPFKLLQLAKAAMPSICNMTLQADHENLLLDFFKEEEMEMSYWRPGNAMSISTKSITLDHELLNVAKDWIMGQSRELFLGWEVRKNREAYIRDMERTGQWRKKLDEEKQEVALELEVVVFASLVNELCHDLLSSQSTMPFKCRFRFV